MFSVNYFIWLAISLSIIIILTIISLKLKISSKTATLIICVIAFLSEMLKIFTHIKEQDSGFYIRPKSLPFHLCSIFIFLYFSLLFLKDENKKEKLIKFIVPVGFIGSLLGIFMATCGVGFNDPSAYQSFIYHSSMFWFSLYFIITKQITLNFKDFIFNSFILFCLAIAMIWINGALQDYETNFFFVSYPPLENLPILNLNHGWYIYFLNLCLTGLVLMFLFHLPYIIMDKRKRKKNIKKENMEQSVDNNKNK